jgi:hypothetical protein
MQLMPSELRAADAASRRTERRSWLGLVVLLLVGLCLWGGLDSTLWEEFHKPSVCTFIAADRTQRSLCWSAGSALVLLVSFSLFVESKMEDLRFNSKHLTPWIIAKKILVRGTFRVCCVRAVTVRALTLRRAVWWRGP